MMDSISYYLCLAALENRDGARDLAVGNVAQAWEIFDNALHILDQLKCLPEISQFGILRTHCCISEEVPFLKDENQPHYAYGKAVMFTPLITETCSMQEIEFYRGVVLFNQALACQMRGKALKEPRSNRRALQLYDLSLRAVAIIPLGYQDMEFLRVAALTNKAVILEAISEFELAQRALDQAQVWLRRALALPYIAGAFQDEDISGFVLNTVFDAVVPTGAACA